MVAVSTWADNFGNWHALVVGDCVNPKEHAYVAIRDELKSRMNPEHFGEDRFSVTPVFLNEESGQIEYVETWEGEGTPTLSDVVTCGECGKSFPPNVAPAARCPYEYDHEPEEKVNHYEFLVTVTAVDGAEYSGLANADELGDCVDELVESAHLDGFEIAGVSAVKR